MKVGIQNKEGRLILVWNDGKRRTMAIGLPDAPPAIAMLKARKASLVFSTPNGLPINDRNFRRRAWTAVLKATGVTYRKPYTCRSTAASHALDNREDYVAVAKALGHPPRVLHDNYAEVIESRSVINTLELIQSIGSEGAHE
jgi:integrase